MKCKIVWWFYTVFVFILLLSVCACVGGYWTRMYVRVNVNVCGSVKDRRSNVTIDRRTEVCSGTEMFRFVNSITISICRPLFRLRYLQCEKKNNSISWFPSQRKPNYFLVQSYKQSNQKQLSSYQKQSPQNKSSLYGIDKMHTIRWIVFGELNDWHGNAHTYWCSDYVALSNYNDSYNEMHVIDMIVCDCVIMYDTNEQRERINSKYDCI